jgi:DNA replication protein DnaC
MNNINDILIELSNRGLMKSPVTTPKSEDMLIAERKLASENKCKNHNISIGNLNEKDGYDCPLCLNRGSTLESRLVGKFYEEVMVMCKCNRVRKALNRLAQSGLKNVARDYRLDNFIVEQPWQEEMLNTAQNYLNSFAFRHSWFFIGGASGCGKSHICTAVAIELLKRHYLDVTYMPWRDEASRLKSMLNNGTYSEELEYYKKVDVLYIDDLFKTGRSENQERQRPTAGDINLAFEILNNRMIDKKITIISTECLIDEIIDFDEALGGRIRYVCDDYCLNIGRDRNKNYRLRRL